MVHLKSLPLPNMMKTHPSAGVGNSAKLSVCDCCGHTRLCLLLWRAARASLGRPVRPPQGCRDSASRLSTPRLLPFSSVSPGRVVGNTDAFLLWGLSGKLESISLPPPAVSCVPKQRYFVQVSGLIKTKQKKNTLCRYGLHGQTYLEFVWGGKRLP